MLTHAQIRRQFWESLPKDLQKDYRKTKKHNQYNATIRSAFAPFIDSLYRDGLITDAQASKITLTGGK